jgi:hypothetical protein
LNSNLHDDDHAMMAVPIDLKSAVMPLPQRRHCREIIAGPLHRADNVRSMCVAFSEVTGYRNRSILCKRIPDDLVI